MTHRCPCGNPVIVDGILPTGFPFGPKEANLAYHYSCAKALGVPRPLSPYEKLLNMVKALIRGGYLDAEIESGNPLVLNLIDAVGDDRVTSSGAEANTPISRQPPFPQSPSQPSIDGGGQ